jgi:hypothetical protein
MAAVAVLAVCSTAMAQVYVAPSPVVTYPAYAPYYYTQPYVTGYPDPYVTTYGAPTVVAPRRYYYYSNGLYYTTPVRRARVYYRW